MLVSPCERAVGHLRYGGLGRGDCYGGCRASVEVLLPLFDQVGPVEHHVVVPGRSPDAPGVGTTDRAPTHPPAHVRTGSHT
jgi:hypothetical protein